MNLSSKSNSLQFKLWETKAMMNKQTLDAINIKQSTKRTQETKNWFQFIAQSL